MSIYLSYKLCNIEPVSIVDLYNSKSDEAEIVNYLTGSSVRGMIMNRLAAAGELEAVKQYFFDGSLRFLDALPMLDSGSGSTGQTEYMETIPSPMGFYEERQGEGDIYHIFSNEKRIGLKRAKVGKFASVSGTQLNYMTPMTGEQFKIRLTRNDRFGISKSGMTYNKTKKKKKQALFRGNYLERGQLFKGYIIFDDSCPKRLFELVESILKSKDLKLGSQRSSGFGGVRLYEEPRYVDNICPIKDLWKAAGDETIIDLLCLSRLCMLNQYGEPCGLNLDELARDLGCEKVSVKSSSSSVTHICGFNRILGGRSAEYPVYEAGSIFRLEISGNLSKDKLRTLEDKGLGIKSTEGYGRILFLRGIEKIGKKQKCESAQPGTVFFPYDKKESLGSDRAYFGIPESHYPEETKEIIEKDLADMKKQCARAIWRKHLEDKKLTYILEHPLKKGDASKGQRGNIMFLCKSLHYHPERAASEFEEYFKHVEDKERRSHVNALSRGSQKMMRDSVMYILNKDLSVLLNFKEDLDSTKILGVPLREVFNEKEQARFRLGLLEEMIRFANRAEKKKKEKKSYE